VQVCPAPVRAARLASGGQCRESNHGGSVPSMESATEALRQRSGINGLTRRDRHLRTARSSLRIEVLQDCRRYIGPYSNVADRRNPRESATLSRWCRSGSMATTG
jgi:hypothetical protein